MPDTTDDGASDSWRKLMERIASEPVGVDVPPPPDWATAQIPDEFYLTAAMIAQDEAESLRQPAPVTGLTVQLLDFLQSYTVPDFVYGAAIQKGRLHALTAPTNHGKTAVLTTILAAVATGRKIGADDVQQGRILMLCGENPEDFSGRLRATLAKYDIPPESVADRIHVIPTAFPLCGRLDQIKAYAQSVGEFILIAVDTNAAYYGYEDEDHNVMARSQAADLRELTRLPGSPAVVASCHPTKAATRQELKPRGGGAFLNEIDTNLVCWADNGVTTLHWQHKIRGPNFEPIQFNLPLCPIPGAMDNKGKAAETVVAVPLTDKQAEDLSQHERQAENAVLYEMLHHPKETLAVWAKNCQWLSAKGDPMKSKVHRILQALEVEKLVRKYRGRWVLTEFGKREAENVR